MHYDSPLLPRVSEEVIQAGLEYGRNVCGKELNELVLRQLYDKMRARKKQLELTRRGEKKNFFREARAWALDSIIPQRNKDERELYVAYKRTIGKMGSLIREFQRQQKQPKPSQSGKRSIREFVALGDNGQYEFILS